MSTSDRLERLEVLIEQHAERLEAHDRLFERLVSVQEQQAGLLRDVVTLVSSIDDRLGSIQTRVASIEQMLRERGTNGHRS